MDGVDQWLQSLRREVNTKPVDGRCLNDDQSHTSTGACLRYHSRPSAVVNPRRATMGGITIRLGSSLPRTSNSSNSGLTSLSKTEVEVVSVCASSHHAGSTIYFLSNRRRLPRASAPCSRDARSMPIDRSQLSGRVETALGPTEISQQGEEAAGVADEEGQNDNCRRYLAAQGGCSTC